MSPAATIVVENESVPKDRRVWNEAQTLRDTGWAVTVVCPRQSAGEARREVVAGIDVRRFSCFEARRSASYPVEYLHALTGIGIEVWRVHRRQPIDVLQLCNPPDVLFPVAAAVRRAGAAIVFDHHDLSPELWLSRGGRPSGVVHKALLAAERRTFRGADVVISNGVLNLFPDKLAGLQEMARVLKPSGRLQIGDILVQKAVPESAKRRIDLWTG